jgi:(p)ppGpp synthase/HD superfamily hydrolase
MAEDSHNPGRPPSDAVTALGALLPPGLYLELVPEEEAVVLDALAEPVGLAGRSPLVQKALAVAAAAHQGQVRKGSGRPYILHPVAVAQLLAEAGCGDEVVAAGLLHDTLEDTRLTLGELRAWFGAEVASIVAGCSEPHKSVPWEKRKKHTLKTLPSAPWEVRVVTCADKLDNVLSMAVDREEQGDALWNRFSRGRDDQAWYHRAVVERLSQGPELHDPGLELLRQLREAVATLFDHGVRS